MSGLTHALMHLSLACPFLIYNEICFRWLGCYDFFLVYILSNTILVPTPSPWTKRNRKVNLYKTYICKWYDVCKHIYPFSISENLSCIPHTIIVTRHFCHNFYMVPDNNNTYNYYYMTSAVLYGALLLVRCYNIITILRCRTSDDNRKTILIISYYIVLIVFCELSSRRP